MVSRDRRLGALEKLLWGECAARELLPVTGVAEGIAVQGLTHLGSAVCAFAVGLPADDMGSNGACRFPGSPPSLLTRSMLADANWLAENESSRRIAFLYRASATEELKSSMGDSRPVRSDGDANRCDSLRLDGSVSKSDDPLSAIKGLLNVLEEEGAAVVDAETLLLVSERKGLVDATAAAAAVIITVAAATSCVGEREESRLSDGKRCLSADLGGGRGGRFPLSSSLSSPKRSQ